MDVSYDSGAPVLLLESFFSGVPHFQSSILVLIVNHLKAEFEETYGCNSMA